MDALPKRLLAAIRIALGFIFVWAFFDKLFGLGYATQPAKSWLAGTSPTEGFLRFGTEGPLAGAFQAMAGSTTVDWLFMVGLLLIGAALILGVALKLARLGGMAMMLLMYAALFPPENNPVFDEHIIYALILLTMPYLNAGETWGLGAWWKNLAVVKKYHWLY